MSDFRIDALVLSWPRLEGFGQCSEPGCPASGFPGSGKCWEHTPRDGKAVFVRTMTREEFERQYPRRDKP